jgi:hypothetical protein
MDCLERSKPSYRDFEAFVVNDEAERLLIME